jgi:membrane-bound lytic murein transglycosylase MltF
MPSQIEPGKSLPKLLINRVGLIVLLCLFSIPVTARAATENPEATAVLEVQKRWKGDFDGMIERRLIRALVVYNKMMYFLEGPTQRGASYDELKAFEQHINKVFKTGNRKLNVVFLPVSRDQLIPALLQGRGDIAAANLTITQERSQQIDFSNALLTGVSEQVVTGPLETGISTIDDLSGKLVYARASSSYFHSLQNLNRSFEERGLAAVEIVEMDENLEDGDLLEMVNAGIIPTVVVDSHKANFWKNVFPNVVVHETISVRTGGQIAWAFRKDSPKFRTVANKFIKDNKKGTLIGNIIYKRYYVDNKWIENSLSDKARKAFEKTVNIFQKYADKYEFDWLMLSALGYQESGLDQSKRSAAGAIGVMQILPSTANDHNVNIPNIEVLEHNIHAGTKYLRFLQDRYFNDSTVDEINSTLFTIASYNAGPARIARLRIEAKKAGFDPTVWFGNVEVIAAKRIGRETVQYVSNIYKYYIAYRLIAERRQLRRINGALN